MGQRKSKLNKTSYDVAPVVSGKDFQYRNGSQVTRNASVAAASNVLSPDLVVPDKVETAQIDTRRVPAWVNEEHFIDILRSECPHFERIQSFKAYPAMSAGENYATLMLRVGIDIELKDKTTQHVSYMLKVPHDTPALKDDFGGMMTNIFAMENNVYCDVIPELEALYKAAGADICLAPKSYKFIKDPECANVLLKDLGPLGFKNADRLAGLNVEQTEWVLRKLAQLHAASAYRVATRGPFSDMLMNGLFGKSGGAVIETMLKSFKTLFLENIKRYRDGDKYYEPVSAYFEKLTEEFMSAVSCNPEEFNVLNHGDCWTNNVLFQTAADGHVLDAQLVDFQCTKYGSPAQDLYYFLLTSTNIEHKLKRFDYFIRYYHDNLIANLKLLQYSKKVPTLRELHTQLFKYGVFAAFPTIITLPVVLLENTKNANFENFLSDNEGGVAFKNNLFTSERYIEYISEILPWLYNRGLLEASVQVEATVEVKIPEDHQEDSEQEAAEVKIPEDHQEDSEQEAVEVELPEDDLISEDRTAPLNAIPDWVTEQHFADILRNHIGNFRGIKKFNYVEVPKTRSIDSSIATPLLQLDIEVELEAGTTESQSYILKVAPEALKNLLTKYTREKEFYTEFLPQFEQMYSDAGSRVTFGPKSFNLSTEIHNDSCLLENLCVNGAKHAHTLSGLDMEHTKCVLAKLAELHAVSACFSAANSTSLKIFSKNEFAPEFVALVEKQRNDFFDIFFETVQSHEGSQEYVQKIAQHKDLYCDIMVAVNEIDESGFNVLNHGDCWTDNIMFQYDDDGKVKSTYFVDYQLAKYGSPAHDLYYFLLSSPSLDLKLEHFDSLVRFYHDNLVRNLVLLNYPKDIPTLKQLHQDLLHYGTWGFYTVAKVLPAVFLDTKDKAHKDTTEMYAHPQYCNHASAILTWLNRRGLLDPEHLEPKSGSASPQKAPTSSVPDWVDEAHFVDVVAEQVKGFSKFSKISAVPATKAGDNYLSVLLRVEIEVELKDGNKENTSYMLKIPPVSNNADDILAIWDFFPKEGSMYTEYLPQFERMYKDVGCDLVFAPKSYNLKNSPSCEYVLLEDLSKQGYRNADRLVGLDMAHTKSVLRKLAQFHAASVKQVELKGAYPDMFNDTLYTEKSKVIFDDMGKTSVPQFMNCIREYEGHEEYEQKMQLLIDNFVSVAISHNPIDPAEFNVLNHGDNWVNNIMFQYDAEGNIQETLLIDFQTCKYGPPAQDLYYFILSSTQLDIKVEQFDCFIKYYHENLVESLSLLKYTGKVPTLKELHTSLLNYGYWGFATLIGVTTICLLEPSENATLDIFTAATDESVVFFRDMYLNPRYKAHAGTVLTWLNRRGLLDL